MFAPPKPVIARFEAVAGEMSRHDFGQVIVRRLDGSSERRHFLASRLKYSRLSRVTASRLSAPRTPFTALPTSRPSA